MTGNALGLSSNQLAFADALVKQTGLNPAVVEAWLAQEQGSETQNPASSGIYNFLNIGVTGSGNYGTGDSAWTNPTTAGKTTGEWLQGITGAVPGWARSTPILPTNVASLSPEDQITAIQHSGWAESGEPALPSLYRQVLNGGGATASGTATVDNATTSSGGPIAGGAQAVAGVATGAVGAAAGAVGAAAGAVAGAATGAWDAATAIPNAIKWVFTNWLRIFEFLAGVALLGLGLHQLTTAATGSSGGGGGGTRLVPVPV